MNMRLCQIFSLCFMFLALNLMTGCGGVDPDNPSAGSISAKKSEMGGGVEKPKTKTKK